MFVKTHIGSLINLDYVRRVTIKDSGDGRTARFHSDAGNEISSLSERGEDALRWLERSLTSTIVPVQSDDFTLCTVADDGFGNLKLYETPIIAFRVYEENKFPEPIALTDLDPMERTEKWAIRFPSGKVMAPCGDEFDSTHGFLHAIRTEAANRKRKKLKVR